MMGIKYLREHETEELYEVLRNDRSKHAARNRAIIYLAKYCALRVSEVGMLHIDDYNQEHSEIYCKREKGSYNNTIRIIDPEVKKMLNYFMMERKKSYVDSKYIFISQMRTPISRKTLDTIFKKYCNKTSISIDKRHFHCLKHTRAVELANDGLDIKEIQWWLGHKNINNTMIYMQFTSKQQDALYEKLERKVYVKQDLPEYGFREIQDEEDSGYFFT